jgi:hypothetical protein
MIMDSGVGSPKMSGGTPARCKVNIIVSGRTTRRQASGEFSVDSSLFHVEEWDLEP